MKERRGRKEREEEREEEEREGTLMTNFSTKCCESSTTTAIPSPPERTRPLVTSKCMR